MYKKADLSFSVAAQSYGNDVTDIQFSTQDKNTAKLVFVIKEKKEPLNLADIDGEITLVMQDKSRFTGKAEVTEPFNGVIEYTVTPEQIRHAGRVQGDLTLKHKNGSSLGGFRFNFTIKKALIDEDLGPAKEFYIQDLEEVKQEVQKKADAVALDIDNFKTDIDTRTTAIEEQLDSLDENVAQSTVLQVDAAKKDSTGQTHADLDSRIKAEVGKINTKQNEFTTQLAEMPRKVNGKSPDANGNIQIEIPQVDTSNLRTKTEKINPEDLSEATLSAITGDTELNLLSIPQDASVTEEKTTFIELSRNMFNSKTITKDFYVYPSTGKLTASPGYNASDFISVKGETAYTWSNNIFYAWFDGNKNFISGGGVADSSTPTTVISPANARYIRVTMKTIQIPSFQFEKGTSQTSYVPFKKTLKGTQIDQDILLEQSKGIPVLPQQITGYKLGKNLFDKTKATHGYYVNDVNGNLIADSSFYLSDYIPVQSNTTYSRKGTYNLAYYDSNKIFLSGVSGSRRLTTFTTPENTAFVRVSIAKDPANGVAGINEEQVELGANSTEYEPFGFTLDKLIVSKEKESVYLNVPNKVYGLVGQELNIYFDNIISDKDTKFDFDVTCTIGNHYERFFRVTPTAAGSYPITIVAYKDDKEVAKAESTLVIKAANTGAGVTKKVLIIGDSTTDNPFLVAKLRENFNADVMKVETIGTRGTSPNKHEGREGWTAAMYLGSNANYPSPFMFNGTFDFSQYITTNALSTPDYVFINLGINDLFGPTEDVKLSTDINALITRYNTMITSIKAQNSSVRVGICLTIPPHYSQDAFGAAYQNGQTRKRYKKNNFFWVKKLIETYGGRETENIYLVPIHLNLDTQFNFESEQKKVNARNTTLINYPTSRAGVHPGESGYWQIADSYWYFLKSFEG